MGNMKRKHEIRAEEKRKNREQDEETPEERYVRLEKAFENTDCKNFLSLWRDMKKFAKEHPDHEFLSANNPEFRRMGWVAFRNNPDEQTKMWTIKIEHMLDSSNRYLPEKAITCLKTVHGRQEILKYLREDDS